MPRTYTTPVTQPDEVEAKVMAFGMVIVYDPDTGNPTADSYFRYVVNVYDDNGGVVNSVEQQIPWANVPAGQKTNLRDMHSLVLTHAENNSIIEEGTDSDDL